MASTESDQAAPASTAAHVPSRAGTAGLSGVFREGTIARLNRDAGFGYVQDLTGHCYIFVFGTAIKRSKTGPLRVGLAVRFRVSGQGRVDELVLGS